MDTNQIINEINKLPRSKKMWLVERVIHLLREQDVQNQLSIASEELFEDYVTDNDLTAFTNLDIEEFYETR